jgi:hypothetical protein
MRFARTASGGKGASTGAGVGGLDCGTAGFVGRVQPQSLQYLARSIAA